MIRLFKKSAVILFTLFFSLSASYAETITFYASSMSGKAGSKDTSTILSGNAFIKTSSIEIYADKIELSGDDYKNIIAQGNIKGKNYETNMEFSCDKMEYDRETKIVNLSGNVDLTDNDNDVKVKSQILNYNQETDIAIIQMQITLTQKDNICSGSYAIYYKKEQILELSGNAQVRQNDDTFRAQHITFDMDTQEITLDGNVQGKVIDSKEAEDSAEKNAGGE